MCVKKTDKIFISPSKVQESAKLDTLSLQMSIHCVHISIYMHDEGEYRNYLITFTRVNFLLCA